MSVAASAAAVGLAAWCSPALAAPAATAPPAWQAENLEAAALTSLNAGSAVNAHDVWVVGGLEDAELSEYLPLIMHWTGKEWTYPATTGISDIALEGVAATSSAVWVSGYTTEGPTPAAFIYHISRAAGSKWVSAPSPAGIFDAQISSGPGGQVWAIGGSAGTIARWTGTAWDLYRTGVAAVPGDSEINSLSFDGAKDGWAVGNNGSEPVVLHWNGTAWSQAKAPALPKGARNGSLGSVLVTPSAGVWATGTYNGTDTDNWLVHWNGSSWATVSLPAGLPAGVIGNISAAASGQPQWIAYSPSGNTDTSEYLYYSGGKWAIARGVTTPGATGFTGSLISVPGSNATWAVGAASFVSPIPEADFEAAIQYAP
jgi:hypothetical protein